MEAKKIIEQFLNFDGERVTAKEVANLLDASSDYLQKTSSADPAFAIISGVHGKILRLITAFDQDTVFINVTISPDTKKELKQQLADGLGFVPLVAGAVIGKMVESIMTPKEAALAGICCLSNSEATKLGVLDAQEGLGFVGQKDIYKSINKKILQYLETHKDLPWRKPWRDGYRYKGETYGPQNYVTANPYSGANAFNIALHNMINRTRYQYFLTRKQIAERGGTLVDPDERIIVWAYIEGEKTRRIKGREVKEKYEGIVSYAVYPIEATKNVKPIQRKTHAVNNQPDEINIPAETLVENMPKKPVIKNDGGNDAYYSPGSDSVHLPLKKKFESAQKYYSTLFHELIHSTGHKKRIGRDLTGKFGSDKYAFEELIAETGAAYLCGVCGIDYDTLKNTAAYLKSWASKIQGHIKQDKTFFFRAVLAATRAANYIVSETLTKAPAVHKKEAAQPGNKKQTTKAKPTARTVAKKTPGLSGTELTVPYKGHNIVLTPWRNTNQFIFTIQKPGQLNDLMQSKGPAGDKEKAYATARQIIDKKAFKPQLKKTAMVLPPGFVPADKIPESDLENTFVLPGEIGRFMGNLQPYKLAINLSGDPHAGKTEFAFQLANAFLSAKMPVGLFSLELGDLRSKDTRAARDRNIAPENQKLLALTGEAKKGIDTVKEVAGTGYFKVIIIDSWQKLNIPATRFDELRQEFPNVIWVVIFQQNAEGGTRGGVASDYDAPVQIKVHKVDKTFKNNFAEMLKNRGNPDTLMLKYMVSSKKTLPLTPIKK